MALVEVNGSVHYYRNKRIGKKVKRIYVGCGDVARKAAALDSHRRLRRKMEREMLLADRRQWEEVCASLDRLIEMNNLLFAAIMLAEGYYLHRGEWRQHREKRNGSQLQ